MIVSPGSRLSASSMTTCSATAPAGTITHVTRGALGPFAHDLLHGLRVGREAHDLVPAPQEPPRHVAAHSAESNHSDLPGVRSPRRVVRRSPARWSRAAS